MGKVLEEYYNLLIEPILEISIPVELLVLEVTEGNDPCWFWAMRNGKIVGLLVYSDTVSNAG